MVITGAATSPHPQPEATAGAEHPQAGAGAHPQPEGVVTPHPLATGTCSVTVWYEPISLVTVRDVVTGYERQTFREPLRCSV